MYHSITIGDKNTYDDWHLVLEERPSFQPPESQTYFIDIPGSNGTLDLSEALTGYPTYKNRTGSFEFIILNDYQPWHELYSTMANYLHNRKLKAILEDDPEYFYEGRFFVTKWKSDHPRSKITVEYNVLPYKKNIHTVDEPWLWDPFSFKNGIIYTVLFANKTISGTTELKYNNLIIGDEPICPIIKVTGNVTSVRYINTYLNVDITKSLTEGDNIIPEIILTGDEPRLIFSGTGTVTISFRKGKL